MTFLETLQAHKGSLIKLKTDLYWYGARGYDESPDRICLLLDSAAAASTVATTTAAASSANEPDAAAALLLIDGSPQWVWVANKAIEILVNDQPTK